MKNLAVFDLETNGFAGSSAMSASSIVFSAEGVVLDFFNRFYLPFEPPDPGAAYVHGLTPERILELRKQKNIETPLYFLEDWTSLLDFWDHWNVEGVVVHNLSFDASFLPEAAQNAFMWWCSMKGLTEYCAIPKRRGSIRRGLFKWPKLGEAADILCNGPASLAPPEETEKTESIMEGELPHISLSDCFELYRIVTRLVKHREELINFAPVRVPFCPPPMKRRKAWGNWEEGLAPLGDSFTTDLLAYEKKLKGACPLDPDTPSAG